MKASRPRIAKQKIKSLAALVRLIRKARSLGQRIVLTNGCFDLLHAGHVRLLEQARRFGDILIVAVNSDLSVRKLKGPCRPIVAERDRALLLAALECVDYVTIFNEETPQRVVEHIQPHVLVKGADWKSEEVVGREFVEQAGGRIIRAPLLKGYSTSQLIARIKQL